MSVALGKILLGRLTGGPVVGNTGICRHRAWLGSSQDTAWVSIVGCRESIMACLCGRELDTLWGFGCSGVCREGRGSGAIRNSGRCSGRGCVCNRNLGLACALGRVVIPKDDGSKLRVN